MNTANASSVNGVSIISQSASSGHAGKMIFARRALSGTTESMRIDEHGNVGIGIAPANSQKFQVAVANSVNFTISANSSSLRLNAVNDAVSATIPLEINSSNTKFMSKVGIGVVPIGTLDINISTDARGSFNDGIGEIGSGVFALQVTNSAGSALKPMGIRAEDIRLVTGSATRLKLDDDSRISLSNNDSGAGNTVFGKLAGNALYGGGNYNLLMGEQAGTLVTTSDHNVAIGFQALGKATANLDGNTVLGNYAMGSVTSNDVNNCVVLGYNAIGMGGLTGGASGAVAVGMDSLKSLTSGASNVSIGYQSAQNLTTGASNVSIGYQAMGNSHLGCDKNVIIGKSAFFNGEVDEAVFIGFNAGGDGTTTTGANGTVGIGKSSLSNVTTGINTAVGLQSGQVITTGTQNTLLGYQAGLNINEGGRNTVVGHGAYGGSLSAHGDESFDNTFIGFGSGAGDWSGASAVCNKNTAVGSYTMQGAMNGTIHNTAIGYGSLQSVTTGDSNSAVGKSSATNITTGSNNTILGVSAGANTVALTTGSDNTIVGTLADVSASGASNQTVIGKGAKGVGNNAVVLGNTSVTDVYASQDGGAFLHATGIKFPATQNTSSSANALDDYEEGSYTPVVSNGTTNYTASTAVGYYTKIGNQVYVQVRVVSNQAGSGGTLQVTLPFNYNASGDKYITAIPRFENIDVSDRCIHLMLGNSSSGTSNMLFFGESRDGNSALNLSASNYENNSTFHFNAHYIVA